MEQARTVLARRFAWREQRRTVPALAASVLSEAFPIGTVGPASPMTKRRHDAPSRRRSGASRDARTKAVSPEARDQLLLQAVVAFRDGNLGAAEELTQRILSLTPNYAPAMQVLGMVAGRTGRTGLGIELLQQVVTAGFDAGEVRNELAILLRTEGRAGEAAAHCLAALRTQPNDAGTHNNLGLSYLAERRLADAVDAFRRAIALKDDVAAFYYNLGNALQPQSRDAEAIAAYRRAADLAPDVPDAYVRLGQLMALGGNSDEATACFARALAAPLGSTEARLQLARLLAEVGQPTLAEDCLHRTIALAPAQAEPRVRLGELQQQMGRFDEALASFGAAIAVDARKTGAYLAMASARKCTEGDRELIDRMLELLADRALTDQDRASLHYALGKSLDDLAHYEAAIDHFDGANRIAAERLQVAGRMIDRRMHEQNIERLIACYTPEHFARYAANGSDSELPLLIVGMIRSGTTLVEQILSSHPDVGAAGELRFWGDRAVTVGDAAEGGLDAARARRIAEDYCSLLRGIAPGAQRVTDKMPVNFLLLGPVHLLLPRARIIHCRRHPVDNCLSVYMTPYSRSPDYAHDRGNIVFYYEQYARLMAHWRKVLPADRLLEVDYEELVANGERVTRQMVAFVGLEWHDACLHHDRNRRAIRTPSVWQARQPIYRTSVGRWQRYAPWLREFDRLLSTASPALIG